MFNYEALVSLSFRLLDLCIIAGLGGFLFFRWVLPNVKKEMKQEGDGWQQLHEEIQSHCEGQIRLRQTLEEDRNTAQRLKHQVDAWRSVVERAQKVRVAEKEHIAHCLQETYQKRAAHIEEQALYKQVMPEAVQQAERELKAAFGDMHKGQLFIADILAGLHKESA